MSKLIKDAGELGHPVYLIKVAALVPRFDLKALAAIYRGQITDAEIYLRALTEFQQLQASLIRLTCIVQNRLVRQSQAKLLEARPTAQTVKTIQEQWSAMPRQTTQARESTRQARSLKRDGSTNPQDASG